MDSIPDTGSDPQSYRDNDHDHNHDIDHDNDHDKQNKSVIDSVGENESVALEMNTSLDIEVKSMDTMEVPVVAVTIEASPEPDDDAVPSDPLLGPLRFRAANPRDIPACHAMIVDSYPKDEIIPKSVLQYRQHHAAPYFRCAVLGDPEESEEETVVGFICSSRCVDFSIESRTKHTSSGLLLAIHSIVVLDEYRKRGIATAMMKDYVKAIKDREDGIEKVIMKSKAHLLAFHVKTGFTVTKPSDIVDGKDPWYELEIDIRLDKTKLNGYPYWVVDSFANLIIPGSGNPAAVVLVPPHFDVTNEYTRQWMQIVAREFNLSETTFIWRCNNQNMTNNNNNNDNKDNDITNANEDDAIHYNIRYLTCNGTEVDLCGHATLAAASVLLQTLPAIQVKKDVSIIFHANKDVLKTRPHVTGKQQKTWNRNGRSMQILMDFPKKSLQDITASADRSAIVAMLRSAFSISNTAENIIYLGTDEDCGDILIHLTSEAFHQVGYGTDINYEALTEWDGYSRGVIICCRESELLAGSSGGIIGVGFGGVGVGIGMSGAGDNESFGGGSIGGGSIGGGSIGTLEEEHITVDFRSRFFGPKAGINEDPVTGSAHCTLGPYFGTKFGKEKLRGKQASLRGGIVDCLIEEKRMGIIGTAVITMSGFLSIG